MQTEKKRPLSPHLSVYKPQISSILSIGHRISGIVSVTILLMLCWWFILLVLNNFPSSYIKLFDFFIVKFMLFIASYTFFYHFSTGIRHLIWDIGQGLSISAIHKSGWFSILLSIILTGIFWYCIWS